MTKCLRSGWHTRFKLETVTGRTFPRYGIDIRQGAVWGEFVEDRDSQRYIWVRGDDNSRLIVFHVDSDALEYDEYYVVGGTEFRFVFDNDIEWSTYEDYPSSPDKFHIGYFQKVIRHPSVECPRENCPTIGRSVPTHGGVQLTYQNAFVKRVDCTCDNGYVLNGASQATCDDQDGVSTWSHPRPTCPPVDCGNPGVPTNGYRNGDAFYLAQSVDFGCNTGYELIGTNTFTCQENGQWEASTPTCRILDCGAHPIVANAGRSDGDDTTFGAEYDYECDPGYHRSANYKTWGPTVVYKCQDHGQWSDHPLSCEREMCDQITDDICRDEDASSLEYHAVHEPGGCLDLELRDGGWSAQLRCGDEERKCRQGIFKGQNMEREDDPQVTFRGVGTSFTIPQDIREIPVDLCGPVICFDYWGNTHSEVLLELDDESSPLFTLTETSGTECWSPQETPLLWCRDAALVTVVTTSDPMSLDGLPLPSEVGSTEGSHDIEVCGTSAKLSITGNSPWTGVFVMGATRIEMIVDSSAPHEIDIPAGECTVCPYGQIDIDYACVEQNCPHVNTGVRETRETWETVLGFLPNVFWGNTDANNAKSDGNPSKITPTKSANKMDYYDPAWTDNDLDPFWDDSRGARFKAYNSVQGNRIRGCFYDGDNRDCVHATLDTSQTALNVFAAAEGSHDDGGLGSGMWDATEETATEFAHTILCVGDDTCTAPDVFTRTFDAVYRNIVGDDQWVRARWGGRGNVCSNTAEIVRPQEDDDFGWGFGLGGQTAIPDFVVGVKFGAGYTPLGGGNGCTPRIHSYQVREANLQMIADVGRNGGVVGSIIEDACETHYGGSHGSNAVTRTCEFNGQTAEWDDDGPLECRIVTCESIFSFNDLGGLGLWEVRDRGVDGEPYTVLARYRPICPAGYFASCVDSTCTAPETGHVGFWSHADCSCDPIVCSNDPPDAPDDVDRDWDGTSHAWGTAVEYSCSRAHENDNDFYADKTVTCENGDGTAGAWSETHTDDWGVCVDMECPTPTSTSNGEYSYHSTLIGSVVTYTCLEDYTINRGNVKTMNIECILAEDETHLYWQHSPPQCLELVCDSDVVAPAPENGFHTIENRDEYYLYDIGTLFRVWCDSLYKWADNVPLRASCVLGDDLVHAEWDVEGSFSWSDWSDQCVLGVCGDDTGLATNSGPTETGPFGIQDTRISECNRGYTPEDTTYTQTCTKFNHERVEFSPTNHVCSRPSCNTLTPPVHGSMRQHRPDDVYPPSNEGVYHYLDTVTFTCEGFYVMSGSNHSECKIDGRWTHPEPTCDFPQNLFLDNDDLDCGVQTERHLWPLLVATDAFLNDPSSAQNTYGPIDRWNTSLATCFASLFAYDSLRENQHPSDMQATFNADISDWDVSKGIDFSYAFHGATTFNADISGWDVSNGVDFEGMFYLANDFNADISDWDVGNAEDISHMFRNAKAFNADISNWDVSNVRNMDSLFRSVSNNFYQDLSRWDTSSNTVMTSFAYGARGFNADISTWDVSQVTTFSYAFIHTKYWGFALRDQFANWDFANARYVVQMFDRSNIDSDMSYLHMPRVTSSGNMFGTDDHPAVLSTRNKCRMAKRVLLCGDDSQCVTDNYLSTPNDWARGCSQVYEAYDPVRNDTCPNFHVCPTEDTFFVRKVCAEGLLENQGDPLTDAVCRCNSKASDNEFTDTDDIVQVGTEFTTSCLAGYENAYNNSLRYTCEKDSVWQTVATRCTPIVCELDVLGNGTVEHSETDNGEATYFSTATYTCLAGYDQGGPSFRTCRGTGVWVGDDPTCTPVQCPTTTDTPNGITSSGLDAYGVVRTLTCEQNYTGDATKECDENGNWTNTFSCTKGCPPLSNTVVRRDRTSIERGYTRAGDSTELGCRRTYRRGVCALPRGTYINDTTTLSCGRGFETPKCVLPTGTHIKNSTTLSCNRGFVEATPKKQPRQPACPAGIQKCVARSGTMQCCKRGYS